MSRQFVRFSAVVALLPAFAAVVADAGALPDGYLRLECVRSKGQVVRTGVVPNGAVPVVKIKYGLEKVGGTYVFGYWSSSPGIGTAVGWNSSKFWLRVGDTAGGGYGEWDDEVHEVTLNASDGTWVDGKLAHSSVANVHDAGLTEYCLLGRAYLNVSSEGVTSEWFEPAKCTLYYATIWLDGEMVRDYVPCRRKSDGAIGLYETVEGNFCTGEVANAPLEGHAYRIPNLDGSLWKGTSDGLHPELRSGDGTLLTEGVDYALAWSIGERNRTFLHVTGMGDYEGLDETVEYVASFGAGDRWRFFKRAEYVEPAVDKGPYFKTGVVPNGRVPVVRLKYRMRELTEDVYAFGYWNEDEQAGTAIGWHNRQFWLRAWKTSGGGAGEADMKDHVVELNTAEGTKLDGPVVHPSLKDVRDFSQSEYCLMGRSYKSAGSRPTGKPSNCRIYGATIWMDGEKVREFTPAMTADGLEYGLFDEVEGRFWRNAGTGEVTGVKKKKTGALVMLFK